MVESLRGDYLHPEHMPKMFNWVSSNKCINAKKGFAGGHTTEYGIFTALYGVYGYHFDDFKREKIFSYGLNILKNNNYKIIGGSASALLAWNNSAFMFEKFDI